MSAIHGGIDPWAMHEAGVDPASIKDFSISINPAPLPESIRDAISEAVQDAGITCMEHLPHFRHGLGIGGDIAAPDDRPGVQPSGHRPHHPMSSERFDRIP